MSQCKNNLKKKRYLKSHTCPLFESYTSPASDVVALIELIACKSPAATLFIVAILFAVVLFSL